MTLSRSAETQDHTLLHLVVVGILRRRAKEVDIIESPSNFTLVEALPPGFHFEATL
jgi:hypothetical protein